MTEPEMESRLAHGIAFAAGHTNSGSPGACRAALQAEFSRHSNVEAEEQVMDIPDLEAAEDITRQVAAAPAARGAAVQNIAELENEDQYHLPVDDQDREINLSLLTACLCAADQAAEELVVWDHELLFTSVASEINKEMEALQPLEQTDSSAGDLYLEF
eukprot:jgi/Astpho2/1553/fgenesh1_pg.00026_%23_35_t